MEWAALFKIFQSWGPSAISSVLVVVVLHLIKKVDANGEEEKKRAEELKNRLEGKIQELRKDTARVLDEHGRRLSCVELEHVKRETFYRELGGWKADINRLSDQLSKQFMEFTKSTIDLWKDKRE